MLNFRVTLRSKPVFALDTSARTTLLITQEESHMYTVVGSRTNRTFRVLWALEELGIEYDHKPYSVRSPEALEHSPRANYLP